MKAIISPSQWPAQCATRRILSGLGLAVLIALLHLPAIAIPIVDLGTASSFAALAGTGITITGPTTITGDIGTFPTASITGFENVSLNGVNHANDAVTVQAKNDLVTAYNDAAGRAFGTTYGGGFDLVGLTLNSGVYHDASSLFLSGTLTLDAQGDPDAVWIFQTGSTLITASDSKVALIGGAQACHIFWQVGSSATLGTGTDFVGNILALTSITLDTGTVVDGRVLARDGAVTLDNSTLAKADCNTATKVPDAGSTGLMLGAGLATLLVIRKRFYAPA